MTPAGLPADPVERAEAAAGIASAYVHLPFCARVCPYCDFAVVAGRDGLIDRYLDALEREIESEPSWRPLSAVFAGGGTPSRLPAAGLARVLHALRRRHGLEEGAEVTLEANPEDWNPELASDLVEAGFTRVSFGVQSFDPAVLAALGRAHSPEDALRAMEEARAAGFGSVSVDLVFGHPVETAASWDATVRTAIDAGSDHVSTYALTIEPGTAMWRDVRAGAPAPDPDVQADRWEAGERLLSGSGYLRYEVSNTARPGHDCLYNLSVWGQGEYLGAGLGAHSHRGRVRRHNVRRLDTYMERVEAGIGPVQAADPVDGWAAEQERLMLGLRRSVGVRAGPGGELLVSSPAGRRLIEAGVLAVDGDRLRVARPLLTDAVVAEVLSLDPEGP